MYDFQEQTDSRYTSSEQFTGFGKKKIAFSIAAIRQGVQSDIVILSHINLLFIAFIIFIAAVVSSII